MKRNACGMDRLVRLVVGAGLLLVALLARRERGRPGRDGTVDRWQILAGYAGAELLLTGLLQWCPLNYALGIDSCEYDWPTAIRVALRS